MAAQVLPQPVAMGTALPRARRPGLAEERVCVCVWCVCVSRRYCTVSIGTGGGRRWRHSRTLSPLPLPRALNAGPSPESINGAGTGLGEGRGLCPLSGQPPHPAGVAAPLIPQGGPRDAVPEGWPRQMVPPQPPPFPVPSPARRARGEALGSPGRTPGTPAGRRGGGHAHNNNKTPSPHGCLRHHMAAGGGVRDMSAEPPRSLCPMESRSPRGGTPRSRHRDPDKPRWGLRGINTQRSGCPGAAGEGKFSCFPQNLSLGLLRSVHVLGVKMNVWDRAVFWITTWQ